MATSVQNETGRRRENYLTMVDHWCIDEHKKFIQRVGKRVQDQGQVKNRQRLIDWNRCLQKFLQCGKLINMPESFSSSQVLPNATIIGTGGAGTGKSVMGSAEVMRLPGVHVLSSTRLGADALLERLRGSSLPGGHEHWENAKTLYQHYAIRFNRSDVRLHLQHCSSNQRMQEAFSEMLKTNSAMDDDRVAEEITRRTFKIAVEAHWKVIQSCYDALVTQFARFGGYRYRLHMADDPTHPYYQPDEAMPPIVQRLKQEIANLKQNGADKSSQFRDLSQMSAAQLVDYSKYILSQETYVRHVNALIASSRDPGPPAKVLHPITLYEEDGRTPGELAYVRAVLNMLLLGLYNPPYAHDMCAVDILSGSTTQSRAIGTTASALDLAMSPAYLQDLECVVAWRSEFFRRAQNSYTSKDLAVCNATFLSMENHIDKGEYTYSSMLFREELPQLIHDAGHKSSVTRFYGRHKDVQAFNADARKHGRNDVPVIDSVFVACNVVLLNHTELCRDAQTNEIKIVQEGLSTLSEAQAAKNRLRLWRNASQVYAGNENTPPVLATTMDDCITPSHRLPEHELTQLHRRTANAIGQKCKFNANGKRTLDDYPSVIEDTVFVDEHMGTFLPTLDSFNNQLRDQVEFETVVNERDQHRQLKKSKKLCQDKTDIADGYTQCEESEEPMVGYRFICYRAVDGLSRQEHANLRMYCDAQADQLGQGAKFSECYYRNRRTIDQISPMKVKYDSDIVIEWANPDYKLDRNSEEFQQSVIDTTNARVLYSNVQRTRHIPLRAIMHNDAIGTTVSFCGIECTPDRLLLSPLYNDHAPLPFKVMTLAGILRTYMLWKIGAENEVGIEEMHHSDLVAMYQARRSSDSEIVDEYCAVVSKYQQIFKKEKENRANNSPVEYECNTVELFGMLLMLLNRIINECTNDSTAFIKQHVVCFNICHSPFYQYLRWRVPPKYLDTLQLSTTGDIRLLGDGRTGYTADERSRRLAQQREYIFSMNPKSMYREQRFFCHSRCKTKVNPSTLLGLGLQTWFPDSYDDLVQTVLLNDCVVAVTKPKFTCMNWSKLFVSDDKPNRFGMMMRRQMTPLRANADVCINKMFTLNGGELMKLPWPFVHRGGDPLVDCSIIAKTPTLVQAYSPRPDYCHEDLVTGQPSHMMGQEEQRHRDMYDMSVKAIEAIAVVTGASPFSHSTSQTCSSSQGATFANPTCTDWAKTLGKGDQIVTSTRVNNVDLLITGNVYEAAVQATETPHEEDIRETKRRMATATSHVIRVRQ